MEREILEPLIEKGLSTRNIAKTLGTSHANTRYWMRKYDLKAQYQPSELPPKCGRCGETDPSKFYGHKRKICGACQNAYNIKQGQDKRLRAVKELGGKCLACGFNQYPCSLDLHHRDATAKDPNFRSMRGWAWERILNELVKCMLLCKNCHAAVHSGLLKV